MMAKARSGDSSPGQLSIDSKRRQNPVEIWGLTGGIASGKSLAARYFAEAGIPVIDADQLTRQLSAPEGGAHEAILARFGTADRAKLRDLVFKDPEAKRDLEAILHPLIQAESLRQVQELAEKFAPHKAYVIYEAALLVETGRYKSLSGLIVIDAPRAQRKERLIKRDGLSPELADRILDAQATDEQRRAAATVSIPNTGTPEELRKHVQSFITERGWEKGWKRVGRKT